MLTDDQRRTLLALARESIVQRVRNGSRAAALPPRLLPDAAVTDALAGSGVFVTLKVRGELRGCLGTMQICMSLEEEVVRCAGDSASEDPRFPPVCGEELEEVRIEISVLGPLERIDPAAAGAFSIGEHGLVVEHRHRRGLLLPQVAVEWKWTPLEFLHHTCLKAGLRGDAWRDGAVVYRFGADVFGD